MYRKVFVAETASQLTINLPIEYLNKGVEVIAFEIDDNLDSAYVAKKKAALNAIQFFNTLQIDMRSFKFDRDEANER
ncbi:hypothetical protein [Dyadobacter frigoris]|uniref:Uncharacterized protein n=1 Tax=Dyadobacter frigoris TaxID=2576211 RepID=A0A4V6BH19_9BACT|nr:hypothetical protein [Dyadobacter frigoris]TKT84433.1 hypothetical protein FDK13_35055 [Dyadobacter frigoris]GLU57459.1 hypothetical protein Dfri01_69200 [Dyadobacter frigoris]